MRTRSILVAIERLLRITYPMQIRMVTASDWAMLRLVGGLQRSSKADISASEGADVGGVSSHWRTLNGDSRTYPTWGDVYHSYDFICPWSVGRFDNNVCADAYKTSFIVPDMADVAISGRGYIPVV